MQGKKISMYKGSTDSLDSIIPKYGAFRLLVRAVDAKGLSPAHKSIQSPRTLVEFELMNHYDSLYERLGDNDGMSKVLVELLASVWVLDGNHDSQLADTTGPLENQGPGWYWEQTLAMKKSHASFVLQQRRHSPNHSRLHAICALLLVAIDDTSEDSIPHMAMRLMNIQLKEFIDDATRSLRFQFPDIYLAPFLRVMQRTASRIDKSDHHGQPAGTVDSLEVPITTLLEMAASSDDGFAALCLRGVAKDMIAGLLSHRNVVIATQAASAMLSMCISLPDAATEAIINPGNPSSYSATFLERALEVKRWICQMVLSFLSRQSPDSSALGVLELASYTLSKGPIRSCLIDGAVEDYFWKFWADLEWCASQIARHDAILEARIALLCDLLCGCICTLTDRGEHMNIERGQVARLYALLFDLPENLNDASDFVCLMEVDYRRSVYQLLRTINADGLLCADIAHYMSLILEENELSEGFQFCGRGRHVRVHDQPVGLANLSQTCYVNSLIQQLYNNIPFRNLIGEVPVSEDCAMSVLGALKLTFAHLESSCSTFCRPVELCEALDIDITVQEDASLFFQDLMSRIESQMPDEEWRKRLEAIFTISDKTQTIGECGHLSDKTGINLVLSLPVKGMSNLGKSLDAYVQGCDLDEEEPFKCERCETEKKPFLVQASRRTCLCDIPDDLVIHLMRFEFDAEDGARKINDPFEFPDELDMAPYTLATLSGSDAHFEPDVFELVGVVIHQGALAFGHYWSYVKRQVPKGSQWVRIEDSECVKVDIGYVLEECRGTPTRGRDGPTARPDNAFMLFYRRKGTAKTESRGTAPAHVQREIEEGNFEIQETAQLFDDDLQEYIGSLLEVVPWFDHEFGTPTAMSVAVKYLANVLNHDMRPESTQRLCRKLCFAIDRVPDHALDLVAHALDGETPRNLLLCGNLGNRNAVGMMLLRALEVARLARPVLYGVARHAEGTNTKQEPLIQRVVRAFELLVEQSAKYWFSWQSLFLLLRRIAELGPVEFDCLVRSNLVDTAIQFLSTPNDARLLLYRPELAKAVDSPYGSLCWKAVALFLACMFDYPMKASPPSGARRDLEADGLGHPAEYFTSEQLSFLRQRRGGVLHFVSNVCTLCSGDSDLDTWASNKVLVCLVKHNWDNELGRNIIDTLRIRIDEAERSRGFFDFAEPLRAICSQVRIPSKLLLEILRLFLVRNMDHEAVAQFTIAFVKDVAAKMPCVADPDLVQQWLQNLLVHRAAAIRTQVLAHLQSQVFCPVNSDRKETGWVAQLHSSAGIIKILDQFAPAISHCVDMNLRRSKHLVAAFLLGLDALEQRYDAYLDFRGQTHLEAMLAAALEGGGRADIDRKAANVYRVRALQGLAVGYRRWAAEEKLDVDGVMAAALAGDEATDVEEEEEEGEQEEEEEESSSEVGSTTTEEEEDDGGVQVEEVEEDVEDEEQVEEQGPEEEEGW